MAYLPPIHARSTGSAGYMGKLFAIVRAHATTRDAEAPGILPLGGPAKRALDVAIAGGAILVLAPLALLIALLIFATMGRPVFFTHRRVGYGHKVFRCYKFRSMVGNPEAVLLRHLAQHPEAEEEWRETQKLRRDPRVTFVGRLLRKSSLDELPQLLNVLRGEMSCVGPRPVLEDELARYGDKVSSYLAARPGMTGLWQVSGRSSIDYERRVALDEAYVTSWSLWLDLRILLSTAPAMLRFYEAS